MDHTLATSDPALLAVAEFRRVKRGFEAWLDANDGNLSLLARLRRLANYPRHGRLKPADLAHQISDLIDLEAEEDDWCTDHESALAVAVNTIPTSLAGVRALSDLMKEQERQFCPERVVSDGDLSIRLGLSTMPDIERAVI